MMNNIARPQSNMRWQSIRLYLGQYHFSRPLCDRRAVSALNPLLLSAPDSADNADPISPRAGPEEGAP